MKDAKCRDTAKFPSFQAIWWLHAEEAITHFRRLVASSGRWRAASKQKCQHTLYYAKAITDIAMHTSLQACLSLHSMVIPQCFSCRVDEVNECAWVVTGWWDYWWYIDMAAISSRRLIHYARNFAISHSSLMLRFSRFPAVCTPNTVSPPLSCTMMPDIFKIAQWICMHRQARIQYTRPLSKA